MHKQFSITFLIFSTLLMLNATHKTTANDLDLTLEWRLIPISIEDDLAWSPDGKWIAFGNSDEDQLFVLDIKTGVVEKRIGLPTSNWNFVHFAVEWSPNGAYVAISNGYDLYVVDVNNEIIIQTYSKTLSDYSRGVVIDSRWMSDSKSVALFDSTGYIELFDILTGKILWTIDLIAHDERIYPAFDWSEATHLFAAPLYTSAIGFWDRDGNLVETLVRPRKDMRDIPESGCMTDVILTSGANQDITSMHWANDGLRLAISVHYQLLVCTLNSDLTTANVETILPNQLIDIVSWSPDGQFLLATFAENDKCGISVFDSKQDYQNQQTMGEQICYIKSMLWSPDGKFLAVSNADGIWIGTVE